MRVSIELSSARLPRGAPLTLHFDVYRRAAAHPPDSSSPVYLLLHGLGLSHRAFSRLARCLPSGATVIGLDLPGFGSAPKPPRSVAVEEYASATGMILDRLGVAKCITVGHSMGVQFALELGIQRPERVAGVVMIGPVVDPSRPTLAWQSFELLRDTLREPPMTNIAVLRDYLMCGPAWYSLEVRQMLSYSTRMKIRELNRPLLVVRGEHDPIAQSAWCRWLSEQLPGGILATIPGKRHVVHHSAPHDVARTIAAFARSLSPRSSNVVGNERAFP